MLVCQPSYRIRPVRLLLSNPYNAQESSARPEEPFSTAPLFSHHTLLQYDQ
jgi:hypothetical protein